MTKVKLDELLVFPVANGAVLCLPGKSSDLPAIKVWGVGYVESGLVDTIDAVDTPAEAVALCYDIRQVRRLKATAWDYVNCFGGCTDAQLSPQLVAIRQILELMEPPLAVCPPDAADMNKYRDARDALEAAAKLIGAAIEIVKGAGK